MHSLSTCEILYARLHVQSALAQQQCIEPLNAATSAQSCNFCLWLQLLLMLCRTEPQASVVHRKRRSVFSTTRPESTETRGPPLIYAEALSMNIHCCTAEPTRGQSSQSRLTILQRSAVTSVNQCRAQRDTISCSKRCMREWNPSDACPLSVDDSLWGASFAE